MTAEHASIAAAFEVSWRRLDLAALRFLALLGLHPGTSTDGYAAAALAGCTVTEAARLLDGLHREGLLTETGYRRYRMHDLIRAYAATQAHATIDTGLQQQAVTRLLGHYTRTAARADAVMTGHSQTPAGNVRPPAPAVTPQPSASPGAAGPATTVQLPGLGTSVGALARAEQANLLACLDHATAAGWDPRLSPSPPHLRGRCGTTARGARPSPGIRPSD